MSRVSKTSNDNQYTINIDLDNISEKENLINKILDKKYNDLLSKNNFKRRELSSEKLARIRDMKNLEKKQMSNREIDDIKEYGRYLLKYPNTNKMAENFFAIFDEKKQKKAVKGLKKDFSSLKKEKKENIDDYRYISSIPSKRLREQMLKETAERRKNAESLKIQKEQEQKFLKERKWENKQLKKSNRKLNSEHEKQEKIQNKINNILKKRKKDEENKNKKPQKKFDFTIPAYWKRYGASRFLGNTITASALTTAMTLAIGSINKSKRDVWVNEMIGNKNPIDYAKHNILMKRMMRAGATREQAVNSIYMLGSALNNPIKLQKMMESTLTGLSPYMSIEQAMKRLSNNKNNIAQQMIRDFFGFDFAKINYNINEKDLKAEEDIMKNQTEIVNAQREVSVAWNKILDKTTVLMADILNGRFKKAYWDIFKPFSEYVENDKSNKKTSELINYAFLKGKNKKVYKETEKYFKEKGINFDDISLDDFENEFFKRLEKEYINRIKFNKMKEDIIQNFIKDSFSNNITDKQVNKKEDIKQNVIKDSFPNNITEKQVNKNITLNLQINQLSEVADLLNRMQNEDFIDKISNNLESTLQNLKIHPDSILLGD